MRPTPLGRSAGLLVLLAVPCAAQTEAQPAAPQDPPAAAPVARRLPPSLLFTLEALGASSGVPDGVGASWYPTVPVRGQRANMSLWNYQAGLTVPAYTTATDGLFVNGSVRNLGVNTNAVLPIYRTRFPADLWDIQLGGAYVRQLGNGWSWGGYAGGGSASDKPFHSLSEMTVSALGFLRIPRGERDGWLVYVVSTTNGQFGRNLPVPGLAYEFRSDKLRGVVGFPFVNLTYQPVPEVEGEFGYAALTDVLARVTFLPWQHARLFAAFEWTNQTWRRAGRRVRSDQLFLYEKRLEGGVAWAADPRLSFRLTGGYAFNRYFVENSGFSLTGRNRVDIGSGPFVALQLELRY